VAGRPLLVVLIGLILVLVISWALGEGLRQRRTTKRRPKR
jgi:hypothetical protein